MSAERKAMERLLLRLLGIVLAYAALRWVLPEVWDKLSPFIIATLIAAALQPVIRFLQKRIKLKRSPASLIPVILLLALFLGLMVWLFTFGYTQVVRIANNSREVVTQVINSVREGLDKLLASIGASTGASVEKQIREAILQSTSQLADWGTDVVKQAGTSVISLATSLPYFIIYLSFLTIGLYFISKNYDDIRSYLPAGRRRRQDSRTTQLTNSMLKSLFGYLRVQVIFSLIVWIVSWIYLTIIGFPYAGITALFCGAMELVPMIGSGLPYIVLSILQFVLGNSRFGILLLALTLGLQVLRRILEPKVMSDNIGITPLQSLIGMFVGMRYGGILGLIGGPVLMSVLVGAYKGGLFNATIRDFHVISVWFKNRLK